LTKGGGGDLLANPDKKFELFTQDIHEKFTAPFNRNNMLILTE
jgi:hypothetical protein